MSTFILQVQPSGLGIFRDDSWTRTNDPIDVNDVLYLYGMNAATDTQYIVVLIFRLIHRGNPGHLIIIPEGMSFFLFCL